MKRNLFRIVIALVAIMMFASACDDLVDMGVREEYQGALLPDTKEATDNFNHLLDLAESQNGPIDGELFLRMLAENVFVCTDVFSLREDRDGKKQWMWSKEWLGGLILGSVMMEGDLFYSIRHDYFGPESDFMEVCSYMRSLGYYGWHVSSTWSYDAETNTLKTWHGELMKTAKVIYFGMGKAVLEGGVAGLYGPNFAKELYLFEFRDTRDEFLNGIISAEEYYNKWQAHCDAEGIENTFPLEYFQRLPD